MMPDNRFTNRGNLNSGHEPTVVALSKIKKLRNRRRMLILHSGTPKTGTPTLQRFFNHNRRRMLSRGILYPSVDANHRELPKHQWLVQCLLRDDFEQLSNRLVTSFGEMRRNTHTVILSTEGIYNHWWDYSEGAKLRLQSLKEFFDVRVWVWFRDPISYTVKYYKQAIKNPRIAGAPECYGRDMTLEELLDDEWFVRRLDYLGFVQSLESLFGENAVDAMSYVADIVPRVIEKLGLTGFSSDIPRANESLSQAATDVLRVINRYPLDVNEKRDVVEQVRQLDVVLAKYSLGESISDSARDKVRRLTAPGLSVLASRYGVRFDDEALGGIPFMRSNRAGTT